MWKWLLLGASIYFFTKEDEKKEVKEEFDPVLKSYLDQLEIYNKAIESGKSIDEKILSVLYQKILQRMTLLQSILAAKSLEDLKQAILLQYGDIQKKITEAYIKLKTMQENAEKMTPPTVVSAYAAKEGLKVRLAEARAAGNTAEAEDIERQIIQLGFYR